LRIEIEPMRQLGQRPNPNQRSELAQALTSCRGAFVATALMSGMSNILMLTGAIFMLEVYDRVLPSRSIPTLVALVILAAGLFTAQGLLDLIRGRVLVRIGARLDEQLSGRVYETIVKLPLRAGNRNDGLQQLRDLDNVRSFLSGPGPTALFDLPWLPVYLAICFAFHPLIGLTALGGAIILGCMTFATEFMTRQPTQTATGFAATRASLAEASRRNAEALKAMGMVPRIATLWCDANAKYMASQQRASDVAGGFGSASKSLRMMLQSGVLAVGAYLVINQQATAGIIIAGSILSARALAPVDLAIANWKGFIAARQGWQRLTRLLAAIPPETSPMPLQPPHKNLIVESVTAAPPGSERIIVHDVSFVLQAGHGLGVIGPSGSGKSTLARLVLGVWQPARGRIRLDGAALDQWPSDTLGASIGYVPQDVELLTGSVAQNIARFASPVDADAVIKAATAAGVHDMIVNLPDGYETQVGESGTSLSAGQAQRIALARALYGDPFMVVLDEPNSNLDAEGDEALGRAIMGVRARGGIVIVVAHRPSAIVSVDQLLMMHQGRVQAFGPKEEVLSKVVQRDAAPRPLKIVPEAGVKS
jgi:PrtD family type I secretion system ABC transporter